MTLFTRAVSLSLVSRVWDFYFLDGIFVLYQTAIGKLLFEWGLFCHFRLVINAIYSNFEVPREASAARGLRRDNADN